MLQGHTGYLEGVGLHSLRGELEGTCVGICSVFQLHGDAQCELSSAADLPGHLSLCAVIIFHMAGWHWLLLCEAWGNRFMQVSCAQITAIRSLAVTSNLGSGLHHSPLACFSGSQRGEAAAKHLSPSPHTHTIAGPLSDGRPEPCPHLNVLSLTVPVLPSYRRSVMSHRGRTSSAQGPICLFHIFHLLLPQK